MKKYPFHFVLLIAFFLTHGYAENYGLLPIKDLIIYFLLCLLTALAICWVLSKIFRNIIKAGIFTSIILLVYLFFGTIVHSMDVFGKIHYRYLLPLILIASIVIGYRMGRSKRNFLNLNFYLNLLFIIFIAYDLVVIGIFFFKGKEKSELVVTTFNSSLQTCDSCRKPDIYFILLDQYSGSPILKKYAGYDNSRFEQFLQSKGFHVIPDSKSNYPTTILSVVSTLNMSFVEGFTDSLFRAQDYTRVLPIIRNNIVTDYLVRNNYQFFNYSIFDIHDQSSIITHHFFPSNMQLILDKTLPQQLSKDLFIDRKIGPFRLKFGIEWELERIRDANAEAIRKSIETAKAKTSQPKFVYAHLLMPHPPYLYDSLGRAINKQIGDIPESELNSSYLNYLVYTNKVVSQLVNELYSITHGNAIIILMSDHGNKHFHPWPMPPDRFSTINAIYFPDRDYRAFYPGFSNVNVFRVLFGKYFQQDLPLLKDSTIYLHD